MEQLYFRASEVVSLCRESYFYSVWFWLMMSGWWGGRLQAAGSWMSQTNVCCQYSHLGQDTVILYFSLLLSFYIIPFCLFFSSLSSFKTHTIVRSHSHNLSGAHQCQIHPTKRANEVLKTSENAEMKFIDYSFDPLFVVLRKLWAAKVTD